MKRPTENGLYWVKMKHSVWEIMKLVMGSSPDRDMLFGIADECGEFLSPLMASQQLEGIQGPLAPVFFHPKPPVPAGIVPEGWRRLEGHETIEPGDMRAWDDERGGSSLERDFFKTSNVGYPLTSSDGWIRFYIRKE